MIIGTLLQIPLVFLNFIVGLFPLSSGFPPEVHTASLALGGYLGILSPMVPLETLATVVGLIFAVELSIFGFKTFKWLFGHVPLFGGKG